MICPWRPFRRLNAVGNHYSGEVSRIRLDKLLIKRKIADSIDEAVALIEEGMILVDGAPQASPSSAIDPASAISLRKEKPKYVSRAGFKLEAAIENFNLNIKNKRCLDIGTSTGGFTDCFLQYGAKEVVSVDVGHGQIDDSLRQNTKVDLFEKTNAKNITVDLIGGKCDVAAVDVSFTSAIPLLDSISKCLNVVEIVVLIKPQFELPAKHINNKGIVQKKESHLQCIREFISALGQDFDISGLMPSPIVGTHGNLEFLCLLKDTNAVSTKIIDTQIEEVVREAHEMRHIL